MHSVTAREQIQCGVIETGDARLHESCFSMCPEVRAKVYVDDKKFSCHQHRRKRRQRQHGKCMNN